MDSAIEFLNSLASKGIKLSAEAGRLECYVQKGMLTNDIRAGIVKYRPEIIALFETRKKRQQAQTDRNLLSKATEFPLSAGQKGLYILDKLHPGMSAYNVPLCFKVSSEINLGILAKAWSFVLEQYPILTARIIEKGGELYHRLEDSCRTTIQRQVVNFTDDEQLLSFVQNRAKQPFDLDRGPLTRIEFFAQDGRKSVLLLTVHHIVFDGASAVSLVRSLSGFYEQLYAGKQVFLRHDLPGYQEFVAWEEAMLASAEGRSHAAYWQQQLSGELPNIELFLDHPRIATAGFQGRTRSKELPENLSQWVREFSKERSLLPSAIFLGLFQLLLHRYTNEKDIIVGMPVLARAAQGFAADVGYFINMVPIRANCDELLRLGEFLRNVQSTVLEALYHASYPFPLMIDMLEDRRGDRNPIFQASYAYQNFVRPADFMSLLHQQALHLEGVPEISQEGDFDLSLEVYENGSSSFVLYLKYNPQLYEEDTIRGFVERYCVLLRAASESPDLFLHEYPAQTEQENQKLLKDVNGTQAMLEVSTVAEHVQQAPGAKHAPGPQRLSQQERGQLGVEWSATAAEMSREVCFPQVFEQQATRTPGNTAVVDGRRQVTYRQLNQQANSLAAFLRHQGVGAETVVALLMERSIELLISILAIWKAGGAYLPLDPEHPDRRQVQVLEQSRAQYLLCARSLAAGIEESLAATSPGPLKIFYFEDLVAGSKEDLAALHGSGNLAYVIYTSGSTGLPKGAMVEHLGMANHLHAKIRGLGLSAADRVAQTASQCFDISVWQSFAALMAGGQTVIVPRETTLNPVTLLQHVAAEHITVLEIVPSLLRAGVEEMDSGRMAAPEFGDLRWLVLTGEALPSDLVRRWLERYPRIPVINAYGPTECSDDVTHHFIHRPESLDSVYTPIGRPIPNTRLHLLDDSLEPVPVGVPGELYVGGYCVGRGYLNDPVRTAQSFVPDIFGDGETLRLYRTGDQVRWLPSGELVFLGRIDHQVKVSGFRIELGEIEARLNQHAKIRDSAVIAQGQDANKQLIAFYRAKDTRADHVVHLPYEELRAHLSRTLPDYMIPAVFVSLVVIPLNSNGKVDRHALARMDVTMASSKNYGAPRNDTERQLVEIWAEVLSRAPETIGVNDSFFELGFRSLLATQVISKIRARLDIDLPLKAVFERSSVTQLAELCVQAGKSHIPPIRPVDRTKFERLPLSFAQERLWFIHQLEPDSAGYNTPGAVTIRGEVDIDQLNQALNLIIARHENLRTLFPSQEGQAQQTILGRVDFKLEYFDLSHGETKEERDSKAKEICQTDAAGPFDLAQGPLLRGKAIKLAEQEHVLMLNMHHIISDGWSIGVLVKELGSIMEALRQGRPPELPPLPIQYVDYSVWQRAWLEEGGILKQQLAYWQEKLAGVPESLDLATDYPRPSVLSFAGATQLFALDAQLTGQLKSLAEQQGGTLFMVLLTVCKVLLYRYTGQNDICVGSPIANRQYGETEGLIGMFVNMLALRSQVEGEDTFADLLSKVKATCLDAYEHQDAPFEKVVDMVRPQRNMAISPLFQVMVTVLNANMGALERNIQPYPLDGVISKFDITIAFAESSSGLDGSIEYSTALYKPQTIARIGKHLVDLCRAIAATPTARIRDLEYLSDAEKRQLLVGCNDTRADYPRDKCIHQLFAEQVVNNPDKTAVVFADQKLSYQELYQRSGDLALYLQSLGVKPDSVVGLCLERSLEMMVGIMGTAQAGGAYLPLDPAYPDDRLAYMLEDSQSAVVLTQEKFNHKIDSLLAQNTRVINLDTQWPELSKCVAALRAKSVELRQDVKSQNASYVIYTSGSTGKPKGVLVEHQALVNRIHWMQKRYSLTPDDVVLQKTPYSFDVSVWEFFWPMVVGASLVFAVPDGHKDVEYLENLNNRAKVTTLHFVPSMLRTFLENADVGCSSVKRIFCSGEALDRKSVDDYRPKFPNAVLHNLYGPTEAAIDVTAYDCSRLNYPFVPIGAPIDNTQIYILDSHNYLQPIGVPGELHIAGDGLARGYLNRPELTQEKFVANPFQPGTRMYKTGDLARWLDDGNIQYLGRIDTQVKIRGFRIELGEIEACLNQHPGIEDSVVIAQNQGADKQLIAFYRAKDTQADQIVTLANEELRAHLLKALPDYMVPAVFVSLAAIPLNPNGKIDRRALERMEVAAGSGKKYEAPGNDAERQLVEIWAQVLKLAPEKIGINDNFFELGGHSLLATQLIAKIRSRLDIDLPLKAIFERSSVAQLAELCVQAGKSDIPPIRAVDRTKFERLPLSFAQERLWFIHQLEPDSAGYNLPGVVTIRGEVDIDQLDRALNLIVARHENLRTLFPSQEGQAQQTILDRVDFKLEYLDLSYEESKEERDSKAKEICQTEAARPFDLAQGPLLRGKAIKLAEQEHVLMLNMHHIISDGWSLGVLIKELGSIMEASRQGRPPELAALPIQYVDYSVWQRAWLEEGGILKQQLAYWQKKLAGVPESLDLATDYPRPSVQSFAGAAHLFVLDAQLTGQLRVMAEKQAGTLFMVLLTVCKVLLYRYTGQNDICVGSPIANRQYGETEGLIGMFVNMLALRSQVEGEDTFTALLSKVKATCLDAYEHQDAPFEKVVDMVRLQRNMAISPLFQVMVTLRNADIWGDGGMKAPGQHIQPYPLESGISKFDLSINFAEDREGVAGSIEYSTALYKRQTIERMVDHFIALCRAMIATPTVKICDLEYLSDGEKQRVLDSQIYILDSHNHLQPIGVPGELHVAGDGLARGYLNRPELTQEKSVANPFQPGTRMYKTGDLARWLDDGNIQYLGRIDTQVKIRGFRIELGEIEACLNQHPEIEDSVVIAHNQGAEKQLIAFYRANDTQADQIVTLPNEELRAHLLKTLPDYMVPGVFVSLVAIPLNPNGKIDRRALERMKVAAGSGKKYEAPGNDAERQLVEIWAQVLKLAPEKIGINDNFFELGGHSLSAVQLMAKINRRYKQLLPLAAMFTSPTIAALAKLILSEDAAPFDILVPIQTNGDAPPLFGVAGAGGNVLSLQPLGKALGARQPFYGLQAVGLDGKTSPLSSVEQTAQANIRALKALQPAGPYSLLGHSYGGVVAYEMARILLKQGEGISSLTLLDSMAPSIMWEGAANDEPTELFDACQTVASLYGANVEVDIDRLRRSSKEENIQYVIGLLNDRGLEINGEHFAAFYSVYQANLLCYRSYRPSMLSRNIDVSLYRATERHQDALIMPPDYGWNQLLQDPIRIYDVEANHFSILRKNIFTCRTERSHRELSVAESAD